ncbi:glycoprotein precursor [Skinner Tank virus]|uniref:Pre-glycoprotein polyprotein GP complex n=1 Tax=Skinner Tank virus TaxID=481886 RepID=B2KSC1_WWAVU|nr:glycoprotein precursor [Skinner Tank virus]
MGQLISLFEGIPSILNEALNVALVAVSIIAILKGIVNIWKSGLLQLLTFLILAGRSCSIKIGHHIELQHVIVNASSLIPFAPNACKVNGTYFLLRGPYDAPWALSLDITDITVLVDITGGSSRRMGAKNISNCFSHVQNLDQTLFTVKWLLTGLEHSFQHDPDILCDNKTGGLRIQINITEEHYCHKMFLKLNKIYGSFIDPCSGGKKFIIIKNVTWTDQCHTDHLSTMHLILQNVHSQIVRARKLHAFFTWSLTDSIGSDVPGGYCLEKWMLISSELKCFGNTAVAKCNLNHDSEFCDMLRLFDFNKKAITTLQNKTKHQMDIMITAINSLISDNILMKNRVRELIDIPYCNYTKFWYVNHTKFNVHSLPKCWLTRNGSYLNISDFRNEWLLESDHLISDILSREYEERQKRTPLGLVDVCFWSTLFYTASIFLHLLRIPTHRHIVGEGCPKPHRLTGASTCSCGLFKQKGRPLRWVRKT